MAPAAAGDAVIRQHIWEGSLVPGVRAVQPLPVTVLRFPPRKRKKDGNLYLMSTFLISDTHFGHAAIIRMCQRPFSDVREMDGMMIANWNATAAGRHGDSPR
jgi:hypothetical protein